MHNIVLVIVIVVMAVVVAVAVVEAFVILALLAVEEVVTEVLAEIATATAILDCGGDNKITVYVSSEEPDTSATAEPTGSTEVVAVQPTVLPAASPTCL